MRVLPIGAALAMLPAGYLAGWWASPPPAVRQPEVAVARPTRAAEPVAARTAPAKAEETALRACEQRIETCEAAARIDEEQANGRPRPWDGTRPRDERPPAVQAAMERVAAECPAVEVGRAYTDCSEYPCLVWLPGSVDEASLAKCPAWPYDRRATGWMWDKGGQAGRRGPPGLGDMVQASIYLAVAPSPSEAPPYWDPNDHYRLEYRIHQRAEEARQEFGGVYATAGEHRMPWDAP